MLWLIVVGAVLLGSVLTAVVFATMAAGLADRSERLPEAPPRTMDRPSFARDAESAPAGEPVADTAGSPAEERVADTWY